MRTKILNTLFIIFLIGLIYNFIQGILFPYTYSSWQISEFMINYQGGFVRRGLLGEVLYYLAKNYNLDIILTVKILCTVLFILVCSFFVYAFRRKGYSLYILPLCFFCGAHIISELPILHFWVRKDNLMILFFILILLVYNKINTHFIIRILLINLLSIFVILNHEVFIFFSLPILFLLLFNHFKPKGNYLACSYSFACLFPAVFIFIIVTIAHGDENTAVSIWNSWQQVLPDGISSIGPAVSALGWDGVQIFKMHFLNNFFTITEDSIWTLLMWAIILPVIYYISVNVLLVFRKKPNIYTEKHKTILSSVFLFQLFCLFPVFCILSCDFARIFFYLSASSFAIFLIVPFHLLENLFPPIINKLAFRINQQADMILPPTKSSVAFLMIFIGVSNNFTFCLNEAASNSLLISTLRTISLFFKSIVELFSI
ncbi:hypothetical protein D0T84_11960 [Dysgonomonas sp. 521]|uniref:hypothetical protein n=1 Tax=Dysgonomonas sp. 521 TaxID=2302932 RepID=UPI0013D6402A|nr:hypothetical protein [Dysgonomonas sp. 521]NDV95621.1 hypothetical protein [Dysgonomonas sp. 521]